MSDTDMRETEIEGADFAGAKLPGHFAEDVAETA